MAAPIEIKVSAATAAAAVSGAIVWALQTYAFHGEVPLPVSGLIQVVVPAAVAFLAGYLTKHTPRPDLGEPPQNPASPAVGQHTLDGTGRDGQDERPVSAFHPRPDAD